MSTGLVRLTVSGPQRRIDLALPEQVPLAELLPELLRHAGEGLADDGERHGGWVLRRTDGHRLRPGQPLQAQGVRDGELLHLVPGRAEWPELEYDDVVEAIADAARGNGAAWSGSATRVAALVGANVLLAVGLFGILRAGPGWATGAVVALGHAALLALAGMVASRAYGAGAAGVTLGGWAMPYAFTGAALLVTSGDPVGAIGPVEWLGAPEALAGSAALLVAAVFGAVGVAAGLRVFAAGMIIGLLGALTALVGSVLPAAGAAAILISVLVCGIGLLPLLAIRFSRLPIPAITLPSADSRRTTDGEDPEAARERPMPDRIYAAVARGEELLTGLLIGHVVLTIVAALLLVVTGGFAERLLTAVAAVALLLRARLFVTLRQRVPLVAGGLAGIGILGLASAGSAGPARLLGLTIGGLLLAMLTVAAGAAYSRRPPTPYLARTADLLDSVLIVSVVPVACAVLGLYARARGLLG
ncbi:MAG TPA: type VII secretion integral membrane protein EccD [Micromonosporaceae bacterium]|nr:type VII secretion integral membrane protein EccD [Micromonosporaceae bacterium]